MKEKNEPQYIIPSRYRRMENLHIVFWLFKDISWCMTWRLLGVTMIIPTLAVSIYIAYRTREIKSELAHNLAVTFWITANSCWMISEFFHFDAMPLWGSYEGKHLAMIPFLIGIIILAWYYIVQRPRELKEKQIVTL